MIITIICPIRFKDEMFRQYLRLSAEGHTVLLPVWEWPQQLSDDTKMEASS